MSIRDKAAQFRRVRTDYDTYAAEFEAEARERADPADFRESVEEMRAATERTAETFAAARREFAEDVRRRRSAHREVAGAVDDYLAAFTADVESIGDVSEFLADVEARTGEFEDHRLEVESFREGFADDLGRLRAAVEELAAAIAARQSVDGEYAAAFAADVERIAAAADLQAAIDDQRETFEAGVSEIVGTDVALTAGHGRAAPESSPAEEASRTPETDDGPTRTDEPAVEPDPGSGETTVGTTDGGSAAARDAGTARSPESGRKEDGPDSAATGDPTDEGGSPASGGTDSDGDAGEGSGGGDAGAGSDGTGDETDDGAGERAAIRRKLREVNYAKLKKAANVIGYEGNLNAATKDDLVEFISENADQVEDALTEADAGDET